MATLTTSPTSPLTPTTTAEVAAAVRQCHDASRAVYPLGGGTALDYGRAPTQPGVQLDLTGLNGIVDYTPRDMTILVEAGVRIADLTATLAAEGQHLPIDVARAAEATIGGVVATNWSGPRRFGHGTIRDYVIGIHAVDGRGVAFKAGGRVVKNVAGYDFCKLLTGSLGTLAVITQLALKVKPRPEQSAAIIAECPDLATAERILARLSGLPAPPVAIDLLIGKAWNRGTRNPKPEIGNQLIVRLEGTPSEVEWLAEQVRLNMQQNGGHDVHRLETKEDDASWARQVEFSDRGAADVADNSPLVVKITAPPSAVVTMIEHLLAYDPDCTIQAHAGNGIIIARFTRFNSADVTRLLVAKLRPAAMRFGGSLVVVSSTLEGLTPHVIWGGRTDAVVLLERVKQKFDPRNILNPGRFAFT